MFGFCNLDRVLLLLTNHLTPPKVADLKYWIFFLYTALCALYIGIVWYLRYRRNHEDRNW